MNVENRTQRLLGAFLAAMPALALLILAQPSYGQPAADKTAAGKTAAGKTGRAKAAPAPTKVTPGVPNTAAASIRQGADSSLVKDLKEGGYILFFRHGATNWNERDGMEGDFTNRANQRNLSEAGQREAAVIGQSIKVLGIPIEKVLASPMWRCRDTAQFAFGDYDTTGLLFWKGATFREARIRMLSTPPAAGRNLVLVGHQDQLIPIVPGLKRDQMQEGDALVFRPLGGGKFRVVRLVTPFEWARLAGVEPPIAAAPPEGSMPASPPDSVRGSKGSEVR